MICPHCSEGTIQKIQFKDSGKKAFVCDACDGLWFEGEETNQFANRTLSVYLRENDREYEFSELNEKDQDHRIDSEGKRSTDGI